jgi:hypothetical protein
MWPHASILPTNALNALRTIPLSHFIATLPDIQRSLAALLTARAHSTSHTLSAVLAFFRLIAWIERIALS